MAAIIGDLDVEIMMIAKKESNVHERQQQMGACAASWFDNKVKPAATSNPMAVNPWAKFLAPPVTATSEKKSGAHVMEYDDSGQALDAQKSVLAAQGITAGVHVTNRASGKTYMVQEVLQAGTVTLAAIDPVTRMLGARLAVKYDDILKHWELGERGQRVTRTLSEVNIFADRTLDMEYWRSSAFTIIYEYVDELKDSMPELIIQVEPRKGVFADAKIGKDKLALPLFSTNLRAFTGKGDYTFPVYGRIEVSGYTGAATMAFVSTGCKQRHAPSWAVYPVNDMKESNCEIRMRKVENAEYTLKVPIIVNTRSIPKGEELKVFKKKVEKEKVDKSKNKRLVDSFSSGPTAKARK